MMRHKGQVVTRAMLFREVWNYKFIPQSNLVDVHIGQLRRKINGPYEPPMIYNICGQGFVLRAPDQIRRSEMLVGLQRCARMLSNKNKLRMGIEPRNCICQHAQ
jgi:DNA-binding winged helix-turn-helix (wHTH) protein